MTTSKSINRFPTFAYLFSWRFLRLLFFMFVCLVTLLALFYAEEDVRGKLAWKRYEREQLAKGEKLSFAEFIPPPIPDDQNLALCPLLKPILDMELRTVTEGKVTRQVVAAKLWNDTNRMQRIKRLDRMQGVGEKLQAQLSNLPLTNGWINLTAWQAAFRAGTNLADAPGGGSAAADVLWALQPVQHDLAELQQEAGRRPLARWPVFYDTNNPWGILLPHLAMGGKRIALLLQLRSAARLAAGETDGGLADIELGLRMAESFQDEPCIISQLVRNACHAILLQAVKEGLARHHFSEMQLADLQQKLAQVNLLSRYHYSLRAERAANTEWNKWVRETPRIFDMFDMLDSPYQAPAAVLSRFGPSGWIYQNQLRLCRLCDQFLLAAVDLQARRALPATSAGGAKALDEVSGPFNLFAKMFLPASISLAEKMAHGQIQLDEGAIACALERHRLAHGSYPETLDALAPRFLVKIPHDILSGQPLKYRRTDEGQYLLYSIGWNEKDEGGMEAKTTKGEVDLAEGDWIWRLPAGL